MAFAEDYQFQAQYLPTIERLLGQLAFSIAPDEKDLHQATDLHMLSSAQGDVACRVRHNDAWQWFKWQVTFRLSRPSGVETEWEKVFLRGCARWYFYGYEYAVMSGGAIVPAVSPYHVLDLDRLRDVYDAGRPVRGGCRQTRARDAVFLWVDLRSLPREVIRFSEPEVPFETDETKKSKWQSLKDIVAEHEGLFGDPNAA
jgi:hypothetical protein